MLDLTKLLFLVFGPQFHVQVARHFDPVFGHLDGQSTHQTKAAGVGGEDPYDKGSPFDLFVESFEHVG